MTTNRWLSLLITASVGCSPTLPASVSIDTAFSQVQTAAIEDALDHWCRAVDFCPVVVPWNGGEAQIYADYNFRRLGLSPASQGGNNGDDIYLDMSSPWTPHTFWLGVAHEIGHWGTRRHVQDGWQDSVMAPLYAYNLPLCLDQKSVDLWCQQNACMAPKSTCD